MPGVKNTQRALLVLLVVSLALMIPLAFVSAAPALQTVPTMALHTALPPNPQPDSPTSTVKAGSTLIAITVTPTATVSATQAAPTLPGIMQSATLVASPASGQVVSTNASNLPMVSQGNLPAYPPSQPVEVPSNVIPGLAWWEILAAVVLIGGILLMVARQKKNP